MIITIIIIIINSNLLFHAKANNCHACAPFARRKKKRKEKRNMRKCSSRDSRYVAPLIRVSSAYRRALFQIYSRTYPFICPSALPRSVCGSIYLLRISIHFAHQSIYRVLNVERCGERQWRAFFLSRRRHPWNSDRAESRESLSHAFIPLKEINYRPRWRAPPPSSFPRKCRNTF